MFTQKTPTEKSGLEKVIDELLLDMQMNDSDSEKYAQMADQLVKLYKLKEIDAPSRISKDTLAIIAGNLAGIVLIMNHERANVVTTKALSFVMKLR